MIATKVNAKIVEDNSGISTEIPVILTDQGVLQPVVDYVLFLQLQGTSLSTLNKHIQSIILLIDFMAANEGMFKDPSNMFEVFVRRLYSGTIGDNGLDPSGLYWIPASTGVVSRHISHITRFTDWMADKGLGVQLNKLIKATPHEERLAYAAWFRQNQNDFLGHIKDKSISTIIKRARSIKGRISLSNTNDDAIAFPEKRFLEFFQHGFGQAKDPRVALRNKLILLLMHGAGFRASEALTLWVTDVFENPQNPDKAIVRIYNEIDGTAPEGWKSRQGIKTRAAYLKEKFKRIPRKNMSRTGHLGWKAVVSDGKDGYLEAYFFQAEYAELFMSLWRVYSKYRALIDTNHPYAFISYYSTVLGRPFTKSAFDNAYERGLRKIGLEPRKAEGLDPHGHRHSYGRRLRAAGIDSMVIKKCMHHKSIESQVVYTLPSNQQVSTALSQAERQLKLGQDATKNKLSFDWKSLVEQGFKDIDPKGYYTGKDPVLGKR